jgi:hypothetical protein
MMGLGKEAVMEAAVRVEDFCMVGMRYRKLSTSIDELEKSDRTVLKPMKLISYELD